MSSIAILYSASLAKRGSSPRVIAGWSAMIGSIWCWSQTSGVDKGPALGIVAAMLAGLAVVGWAAFTAPVKKRRSPPARAISGDRQATRRQAVIAATANGAAMIVLGLAAAIAATTALFMAARSLGADHSANLAMAMFAFPLAFGAIATFIGMSDRRGMKACVFTALTGLSAMIIAAAGQGG